MTKPIFKRNVITKEMISEFKIFDDIWLEYCDLLPIGCYEFDIFIKNITKIRKDDFNFNDGDIGIILFLFLNICSYLLNNIIIYIFKIVETDFKCSIVTTPSIIVTQTHWCLVIK